MTPDLRKLYAVSKLIGTGEAIAAYLSGDEAAYCRHILICDALRRKAGVR